MLVVVLLLLLLVVVVVVLVLVAVVVVVVLINLVVSLLVLDHAVAELHVGGVLLLGGALNALSGCTVSFQHFMFVFAA